LGSILHWCLRAGNEEKAFFAERIATLVMKLKLHKDLARSGGLLFEFLGIENICRQKSQALWMEGTLYACAAPSMEVLDF
jgi:hypothetical protein